MRDYQLKINGQEKLINSNQCELDEIKRFISIKGTENSDLKAKVSVTKNKIKDGEIEYAKLRETNSEVVRANKLDKT